MDGVILNMEIDEAGIVLSYHTILVMLCVVYRTSLNSQAFSCSTLTHGY